MRGGLPPLPAESGLSSRGKTFDYSEVVPVKASRKYKQSAVIVDVDGTIARMTRRDPHDYAAVGTDAPIDDVIKVVRALHTVGYVVILLSGRKDSCREETMAWLDRYLVFYDKLLMRSAGDNRVDWKVKYELFNEHIRDEYYVVGAFDDRRQCLLLWEAMGITTFHVGGVDGGDF